ncbi:MAG: OB-fold domain-containing protein [Novosphingobium sp.]|nr:OB-fold domain-containing protein [Novosphingobium sp.]
MSTKPKVQPDDLDLAFYQATAEVGQLCLQHCGDCGQWTHPARYYCPNCSSENYSFQPVSGAAEVHSFTVSHFSVEPAWRDRVPYVTIVAETAEGPRLVTRTEMSPADVSIGIPIRVKAEVVDPEFSYVWAEPAP